MEKSRHHPKPRKATTKLFLKLTMAHRFRIGMLARIRIGNGRLGVLSKAGGDTDLRRWFQLLGRTDFAISYCSDKKKKVGAFGPDHNHLSSGQLRLLLLDENSLDATRTSGRISPLDPPSHPPPSPTPHQAKGHKGTMATKHQPRRGADLEWVAIGGCRREGTGERMRCVRGLWCGGVVWWGAWEER